MTTAKHGKERSRVHSLAFTTKAFFIRIFQLLGRMRNWVKYKRAGTSRGASRFSMRLISQTKLTIALEFIIRIRQGFWPNIVCIATAGVLEYNGVEYTELNRVVLDETTYLLFADIDNPADFFIRKLKQKGNTTFITGLDTADEFDAAFLYLTAR